MNFDVGSRVFVKAVALLSIGGAMTDHGYAAPAPQARLVHCGEETCVRISGHRTGSAVAVRIGGKDLPVTGAQRWQAIVPLEAARKWATAAPDEISLSFVDARLGTETSAAVMMPPGALGRLVELADLIVRAR